ncbi:MAG: hypothetical protein ACRC41_05065 [Sarcina sp.]
MQKRLKIIVEFSIKDENEIKVFEKLNALTYPGTLIKDILCKRIPFTVIENLLENAYENN